MSLNEVLPHLLDHFARRERKLPGVRCTLDVTWQPTSLDKQEAALAGNGGQDGVEKQDVDPLLAVAPALTVAAYSKFQAIAMLNFVIKRNRNNAEAHRSRAHLWAAISSTDRQSMT